nr:tRNA (adenosine(37)-N6)-threonylcarbamoyltransferase complex ATPase subunit type 1 TsaE [uncultured Sphingomonas sp.]
MILADEAATEAAGARIGALLRAGDVVTLSGPLAAGKTTLVRGLIAAMGHHGEVPSPSFSIVQPYEHLDLPLWHVDLYRVDNPLELQELGLSDILSDGVLIVEWPEKAGGNRWPQALALSLDVEDDDSRTLTAQAPAAWEGRWPLP